MLYYTPPPEIDALRPSHAHHFRGNTSVTMGHFHLADFYAYAANGSANDKHTHRLQGYTYVNDKHFHRYLGNTGPAIPLPDGSHYHMIDIEVNDEPFITKGNFYSTVLSIDRHTHRLTGPTGTGIGYEDVSFFL